VYKFRGNGPYDPDLTGVGVQPYGWDTVDDLYGSYTAVASKIKVFFTPDEETTQLKVWVIPSRTLSPTNHDASDLRQAPGGKQVVWLAQSGKERQNRISNYYSTKRMYPEINPKDSGFQAPMSADPDITWYWLVYFDSDIGSPPVLTFDVEITYYVVVSHTDTVNES